MKHNSMKSSIVINEILSKIMANWLLFVILPFVAILGFLLIVTAPLDGSARSSLGGSLLTGVVVGVTLIGFESTLDRRRDAREEQAARVFRKGMLEAARSGLSLLLRAHLEIIWMVLAKSGESHLHERAQPPSWQEGSDEIRVQRALVWLIEIMRDDVSWWKDEGNLAKADAIYFVASDLAERYEMNIDEPQLQNLYQAFTRALGRLNGAAQRLSESGDTEDAASIDMLSDSLEFHDTPSYIPRLSSWGNEYYDNIITTGSVFSHFRKEFSWLTAELRESKVRVDRDGNPVEKNPPAAESYRWGSLFLPGQIASSAWDQRFHEGSWFRRIMDYSDSQVPKLFGINPERDNS